MIEAQRSTSRFWKFFARNWVTRLHEIVLSLNIACALGYSTLLYVSKNLALPPPANDSGYYFLRGAARVGDLLRAGQIAAVSTDAVARQAGPPWRLAELTSIASLLAVAVLVVLFIRLFVVTPTSRLTHERAVGFAALFTLPACYLVVSRLTWSWQTEPGSLSSPAYPFWQSRELLVFVAEILCLGIYFIAFRKRTISLWLAGGVLTLHYGFWIPDLWAQPGILAPYFLLLAAPVSGVVWMLYINRSPISSDQTCAHARPSRVMWTTATVALAFLLVIWLPRKGFSLTRTRDIKSIAVQLSRGPCRGTCPSYTMTIRGSGVVEYVGIENVRIKGPQSGEVSSEQFRQILKALDDAHFSTLEDRAFMWCFDSSSVAISVTVNGRVKQVASDGGCIGARSGIQAGFVRAADELDSIAGSDKWVKCDEEPCR